MQRELDDNSATASARHRGKQVLVAAACASIVLGNFVLRTGHQRLEHAVEHRSWPEARGWMWLPMSAAERTDCLVLAAAAGDENAFRGISAAQINQQGIGGQRVLAAAAGGGHRSLTLALLKAGAVLDAMARRSRESKVTETALDAAARNHHFDLVVTLLDLGADPNKMPVDTLPAGINNEPINPALFDAAAEGSTETVLALLAKGANPNLCTALKEPPLSATIYQFKTSGLLNADRIAFYLLKAGANPNLRDLLGETPLYRAAAANATVLTYRFLNAGARVDLADNDGTTPLIAALQNGAAGSASVLLQHGANPCTVNRNQITPEGAARLRCPALASEILRRGGHLSLMEAVSQNDQSEISWRLRNGSSSDARLPDGSPMLSLAAKVGNPSTVIQLLVHGATLDARDPSGWTPLMVAAANGNSAVVRLLVENHANTRAKSATGRSAFDLLEHLRPEAKRKVLEALSSKPGPK
jgi:ankyrin repeat protein